MQWVFWIFNLSEHVLCDHITTIVQTIYTRFIQHFGV